MTQLERLRETLRASDVPSFLVSDLANIEWLTSFTGSFGYVVVTPDEAVFLTDSRYTVQAAEQVQDLSTRTFRQPTEFVDFLHEQVESLGISRLRFDSANVTVANYQKWKARLSGIDLLPAEDPIARLRMVKSATEIEKIRAACRLADACLENLVQHLKTGRTENDLLWEIHGFMRQNGATVSFSPIVVSGLRSARPHGMPSDKPLEKGDFVTVDLGAKLSGYCSDITRTFVIGKASTRQREIYNQVLEAQEASILALVPGANGRDVDALARRILDRQGLGAYFGHGLGHGLGMLVHDTGRLSPTVEETIEPGQVWTVEPGVYLEELGGVRIEDDVLVTDGDPEVLTSFPKELIEVG